MSQIDSVTHIDITYDYRKGEDYLARKREQTGVLLNLLETPVTWFHWNEKDINVKEAPPDIFDAWISQYVDEITDVDRAAWDIFQRWEIINACIWDGIFRLQRSEGKASIVEVESEEKASCVATKMLPLAEAKEVLSE